MALLGPQFFTILKMDKEFAFTLAQTLKRTTEDLLDQLNQAIKKNDALSAKKVLHTLKGGSANFGAEDLTIKSQELENEIVNLTPENTELFLSKSHQLSDLLKQSLHEVESYE
jgi:HPt (histidine-containing phosphotransfer) domain-containing protein